MSDQLRSELLKLRSTRTSVLLFGSLVGILALVVALHVLSFPARDLVREDTQLRIAGLGVAIGGLFAAMLGALSVTSEFRSGTIRPTLLVTPSRGRVLAGKVVACALAGAAIGLLAEALTAGALAAGLAARGIDGQLAAADHVQLLVGGMLSGALLAVIGVGVGAAVRNQIAALVGLCLWLLFVEPLLLGDVPAVGRYAPEASAGAVAGALQTRVGDDLAAPALGALLLTAYAALAALAGACLLNRRDVD